MFEYVTPEIISAGFLVLIALVLRAYMTLNKSKVSLEDQQRLDNLAKRAVQAAEQQGKREGWSGAEKLSFAQDTIKEAFPKIDFRLVGLVIDAALTTSDLGATSSSKSDAG